jgi:Amidohydrolase family
MDEADLIVRNARVTTLQDDGAEAKAFAVRGERFVAVGGEAEVMRLGGGSTRLVDAGGRRVIPGLNDSHLHAIRGGLQYSLELRWDGVESLQRGLEMIRQQAERTPEGEWVRVMGGWSPYQFAFLAQAKISRHDFGLTHELTKEAGSLLVRRDVELSLAVEAIRTMMDARFDPPAVTPGEPGPAPAPAGHTPAGHSACRATVVDSAARNDRPVSHRSAVPDRSARRTIRFGDLDQQSQRGEWQ